LASQISDLIINGNRLKPPFVISSASEKSYTPDINALQSPDAKRLRFLPTVEMTTFFWLMTDAVGFCITLYRRITPHDNTTIHHNPAIKNHTPNIAADFIILQVKNSNRIKSFKNTLSGHPSFLHQT
jgi:hypothetical protein